MIAYAVACQHTRRIAVKKEHSESHMKLESVALNEITENESTLIPRPLQALSLILRRFIYAGNLTASFVRE